MSPAELARWQGRTEASLETTQRELRGLDDKLGRFEERANEKLDDLGRKVTEVTTRVAIFAGIGSVIGAAAMTYFFGR